VSSFFDFLTFGALIDLLKATPEQFRTGWFLESVMTELLIVPVIRTRRPFYHSRPGKPLLAATVIVFAATLALPYLPVNDWLGFTPLPASYILVFVCITAGYLIASELTKKIFYRRPRY
jgi:Mg2+-importing ATPase